jgi:shikimate dehydrogenase
MTIKTGLIGYPVEHSLLPIIYNAAYRALELDWEYDLYPCADAREFNALIALAKKDTGDYLGFNVIAPCEDEAFRVCSVRSEAASICQSVNVLTIGRLDMSGSYILRGDTTNGLGLLRWMAGEGIELADATVAISGVGLTVLPILYSLIAAKVRAVNVLSLDAPQIQDNLTVLLRRFAEERYHSLLNKTGVGSVSQMLNNAKALQEQGSKLPSLPPVIAFSYDAAAEALARASVLINTTPVGMDIDATPAVSALALHHDLVVVDLAYVRGRGRGRGRGQDHRQTSVIQTAHEMGLKTYDGLGTLIEQSAQTIEMWAKAKGLDKLEAPRDLMRSSVS